MPGRKEEKMFWKIWKLFKMPLKPGHSGEIHYSRKQYWKRRDNLAQCWYQHSLSYSKRNRRLEVLFNFEGPCLVRESSSLVIHMALTPACSVDQASHYYWSLISTAFVPFFTLLVMKGIREQALVNLYTPNGSLQISPKSSCCPDAVFACTCSGKQSQQVSSGRRQVKPHSNRTNDIAS